MSSNEGVGRFAQEAVTGGVLGGILSALPIISIANLACCGLNITGAIFGLWLWFRNYPDQKLTNGDVAMCGGISGAVAGVVSAIGDFLTRLVLGPTLVSFIEGISSQMELPSELVSMLLQTMVDPMNALYSAPFNVGLFGGFGVAGALLAGQLLFKDRIASS